MNRKTVVGYALGPLGVAMLGVITTPVLAWYFNAEDIGRYALLQIYASFALMVFSLGLDQAYVREYHEVPENQRRNLFIQSLMPGVLLSAAVITAGLLFGAERIAELLFQEKDWWVGLAFLSLMFFLVSQRFLMLVVRMRERSVLFSMAQLVPKAMLLMLVPAVILFGVDGFLSLQVIYLMSMLVGLAFLVWCSIATSSTEAVRSARSSLFPNSEMWKFGLPLVPATLAYWCLSSLDRIAVSRLASLDELGVYAVALNVALAVGLAVTVFNTIWAPMLYKEKEDDARARLTRQAMDGLSVLLVLVVLLGIAFSWMINFLLPSQYVSVRLLVVPLTCVPILYAMSEASGIGINLSRKTWVGLGVTTCAAAVNVALLAALVPELGAAGASIATCLAMTVFVVLRTESSRKLWTQFPRLKFYFLTAVAVSLACAFVLVRPTEAESLVIGLGGIAIIGYVHRAEVVAAKTWLTSHS